MKKLFIILLIIITIYSNLFSRENEVNVYLYNFHPVTATIVKNKLTVKPAVEVEIRNFKTKEFNLLLTLVDSGGSNVFRKSQKVKRDENDDNDYVVVRFWLDDKIPFPVKALVEVETEDGIFKSEIELKFARIYGKVTDFDGNPLKEYIFVKDSGFEDVYAVVCNENGEYEMILPQNTYNAVAVFDEGYAVKTLERWGWNFNANEDKEINFKVGTVEVYNIHLWPNNGGPPTVFVSFRAMSVNRMPRKSFYTFEEFQKDPYSGLAPALNKNNVKIFFDGNELKVVSVTPYPEFVNTKDGRDFFLVSYLVQALRGNNRIDNGRHNVKVVIEAEFETDGKKIIEKGEGSYSWIQEVSIQSLKKYNY